MTLALLLALAATAHVELVDEVFRIPAAEWRYVEVLTRQEGTRIRCDFAVEAGGPAVRVALLRPGDLGRLRAGQSFTAVAEDGPAARGRVEKLVREAGTYSVVLDNRSDRATDVRLQVALSSPGVRTLSPQRRTSVIGISLAVFLAICGYAARKLLPGTKP